MIIDLVMLSEILGRTSTQYPKALLGPDRTAPPAVSPPRQRIADSVGHVGPVQHYLQRQRRRRSSRSESRPSARGRPDPTPQRSSLVVRATLRRKLEHSRPSSALAQHVHLQKRRVHVVAASPEHILVLCACSSLARDFRRFELESGWRPEQDNLIERMRSGREPAVQQMSKNAHLASDPLPHACSVSHPLSSIDRAQRSKQARTNGMVLRTKPTDATSPRTPR